jgi:hypothetical protein
VPDLDERWHWALLTGAKADLAQYTKTPQEHAELEGKFQAALAKMRTSDFIAYEPGRVFYNSPLRRDKLASRRPWPVDQNFRWGS